MLSNLSPDEARALVLEKTGVLSVETLPLEAVFSRILAQSVVAPFDLPPFDNSAMDGFAVRAADLKSLPARLKLLEIVGAGEIAQKSLQLGQTTKIMTGAPIPSGADCVVMHEETRDLSEEIEFLEAVRLGQNIRRAGEDVAQNEVVLEAGTRIGAAQWAMLASLGQSEVAVFRRPKVGILATGKELVAPGEKLGAGQINDSNSFALRGLVAESGAEVVAWKRVGDGVGEVETALRELTAVSDVVVSSGGVSAGDFDPIRDVLKARGEIHFWKIAMKPGKPVMFADFAEKPVFGLPGNPVSVIVSFEEFVRPALQKMAGLRDWKRLEVEAVLTEPIKSPPGKTEFVRACVTLQNAVWTAQTTGPQGSGRLSTMTRANALLVIPAQTTKLEAGAVVKARMLF